MKLYLKFTPLLLAGLMVIPAGTTSAASDDTKGAVSGQVRNHTGASRTPRFFRNTNTNGAGTSNAVSHRWEFQAPKQGGGQTIERRQILRLAGEGHESHQPSAERQESGRQSGEPNRIHNALIGQASTPRPLLKAEPLGRQSGTGRWSTNENNIGHVRQGGSTGSANPVASNNNRFEGSNGSLRAAGTSRRSAGAGGPFSSGLAANSTQPAAAANTTNAASTTSSAAARTASSASTATSPFSVQGIENTVAQQAENGLGGAVSRYLFGGGGNSGGQTNGNTASTGGSGSGSGGSSFGALGSLVSGAENLFSGGSDGGGLLSDIGDIGSDLLDLF